MLPTIPAKTILQRAHQGNAWFGIDYNMNLYRGCNHGCIYCDSRSSCYQNPDFDTVKIKENALMLLRDELRRKTLKGVIGTGAMSDPYNAFEKKYNYTRHALELLHAFEFGVSIATKSALVTRDLDILSDIKKQAPTIVQMSITTLDNDLCRKVEPHVSSSKERFHALQQLSDAGIFAGVLMMPILPFINDTVENINGIVEQAAASGAQFIYPAMGMTLRDGNRQYFFQALDKDFPGIRQIYEHKFGTKYNISSPKAQKLWDAFKKACETKGIRYRMKDIVAAYHRGYPEQMSLFDLFS